MALQLFHGAGTDDGRRNAGVLQYERHGQMYQGDRRLVGQLPELVAASSLRWLPGNAMS